MIQVLLIESVSYWSQSLFLVALEMGIYGRWNGFTIKMSVLIPYRDVMVRWDRNDNDMDI